MFEAFSIAADGDVPGRESEARQEMMIPRRPQLTQKQRDHGEKTNLSKPTLCNYESAILDLPAEGREETAMNHLVSVVVHHSWLNPSLDFSPWHFCGDRCGSMLHLPYLTTRQHPYG
jgi:hypothetical protein